MTSRDIAIGARLADERGSVVIMRNNVPRYVLLDYAQIDTETAADVHVLSAGARFLAQHRPWRP